MAVNRVPVLKRCRSLGMDPVYLGIDKKSNRQLKRANRKMSEYGLQLREKQKAKFIYGVLEKPFLNYFKKASKMNGMTGENLMVLLESRLDNVVFRLGLARTRREARQIVDHKHVLVNGKCVNIPSYLIKAGDVIEIKESAKSMQRYKDILDVTAGRLVPEWIDADVENFKGAQPKATPLARKIAADLDIDLATVSGTGFGGKITKEDILAISAPAQVKVAAAAPAVEAKPEKVLPEGVEVIPMSAMRKAISKGMTHSYLTAPTFTLNYDVDMTNLIALRKQVLDPIMNKTGMKVTFTDLIGLAVVRTLMKEEHRYLNASLINDAQNIELHKFVNLGIAVGLDDGLVVPVVHGADKMSLSDFVVASKDVIKKAQAGKLKAAEMSGSTFSITNLGMFGTKSFNPIINQPNSAILGVSATIQTPVVVDGEVVVRPIMGLCLTIDHRIVDGMNGAKFMVDLKHLLENPMELLI